MVWSEVIIILTTTISVKRHDRVVNWSVLDTFTFTMLFIYRCTLIGLFHGN